MKKIVFLSSIVAKKHLSLLFLLIFCFFQIYFAASIASWSILVSAQGTDPIEEVANITAEMPDVVAPSTPILIAPENNSLLTDNAPEFIWTHCTDNVGVSYYQFYLDGDIKFDNIPLINTDNSNYTLILDPLTGYYHLTPKISFSDGSHTWKIMVFDEAGNFAESVTWTFTIDSTAPTFVITQIGEVLTSISAQDTSTIPNEPIELEDNEPLLIGTGEANSDVTITIQIPDSPDASYNFAINSIGDWEYQMGILPRDIIITLNFLIRDQAGNISVLEGVQIIIPTPTIIIPPEPTTPPTSITLAPGSPTPTPALPQIVIPLIPIKEIIYEIIKKIPLIADIIKAIPKPISKIIKNLAPVANIIVSSLVPIISTVAIASQFGGQLSFNLLTKILQALGLLPAGKPQGLVFDSETNKGIPFAILTLSRVNDRLDFIINEKIITNDKGLYRSIKLPTGKYRLSVRHQKYLFPTQKKRPLHLGIKDFYRGEIFNINNEQKPEFLLVPMDKTSKQNKIYSQNINFRLFLARLARFSSALLIPLFLFSLLVVSFYPTIWNWAMVILYTILVFIRLKNKFIKPDISGVSLDEKSQQPLENVVIKLVEIATGEIAAVTLTNKNGQFFFYNQKDEYQIIPNKINWIWMQSGGKMKLEVVDSREQPTAGLMVVMKRQIKLTKKTSREV